MGVTQTNTLKAIELGKNPIPVVLSTDEYITTEGETAWIDLLINSKDAAADLEFRLQWGINDIIFTSKASPDESGTQFTYGSAFASITLWLDDIVDYLNKNITLSTDFRIWHTGSHLYLESYEKGDDYTLTFSTADFDWSEDDSNDGITELIETNYKLGVSVFVFIETRGDFQAQSYDYYKEVKQYLIEPLSDSTGTVLIDGAISPYFKEITLPQFSITGPQKAYNLLLKYYYKFFDQKGTLSGQENSVKSDVLLAINGGINRRDFNNYSFYDDIINGTEAKFLSWHPLIKRITKTQNDFLYFIQKNTPITLNVRYVGTKLNGSTATVDVNIFYNDQHDVHIIPVNYTYVKSLFSVDLLSYTVQMVKTSPNANLSEKRTFKVIQNTPLYAKNYIYRNSLGVYEGIALTGEISTGVEVDKIEANRILGYNESESTNKVVTTNIEFNLTNKVYTGFHEKAELHAFIEFIKSDSIFEQTDSYYKPVKIKTKRVSLYKEDDNISSASVEIIDNTEKNYSNA